MAEGVLAAEGDLAAEEVLAEMVDHVEEGKGQQCCQGEVVGEGVEVESGLPQHRQNVVGAVVVGKHAEEALHQVEGDPCLDLGGEDHLVP